MSTPKTNDRAIGDLILALLLVLAWLVTDHYPPWTAFHSETLAALAGFVAVVGAWRRAEARGWPRPVWLLLALALLPWLQWAVGMFPFSGDAVLASLYLAGTGLCFWAGQAADARRREELLQAVAAAMLIAAILTTGVTLYQWFGLRGLDQVFVGEGTAGHRAVGNLGQPNHVATLLCMGLAVVVLARAQGAIGNAVAALAATYLALGLALTQSRVPWVALALLALWMVLRRRALFAPLRLPVAAVFVWLAAYGLLFWAAGSLPELLFGGSTVGADASRVSVGRRPVLWAQWLDALRQAPWTGYGWLQGHAAQTAGAFARPGVESSDYAHTMPLDLLAWTGLPLGLLLLVLLAAWILRAGWRAEGASQWFRLAALTLLLAHALVEYAHAYVYFLVPVALLAGPLGGVRDVEAGRRHGGSRWAVLALTLACAAGVVAVVRDYLRVEPDIRALREQTARIGGLRTSAPVADLWVLDQMAAFSRVARLVPAPGLPAEAIDELQRATRRFSSVGLLQQQALVLALSGRLDEAKHTMHLMCVLNGLGYELIAIERIGLLAREQIPAALPFAELLERAARDLPPKTDNRRPTCLVL